MPLEDISQNFKLNVILRFLKRVNFRRESQMNTLKVRCIFNINI